RTIGLLFKLIKPGLESYINITLLAPVVMMEGLSGSAALDRSKKLVANLRGTALRLQVREFFLALLTTIGFMVMLILFGMLFDFLNFDPVTRIPLLILLSLIPALIIILIHPIIAIAMGNIYLKARQIGNEKIEKQQEKELSLLVVPEGNHTSKFRTVTILT